MALAAAQPVLWAVVLLGLALRLYHFDVLSLWSDEGLTVAYSRLPWPTVLGLHGAYSPHPPLYFALTKLVATVVPDLVAGRLISVVAGALTIPLVFALGARLAGPRFGTFAALVLALSPLAIWYSQEGRPYALNVLLVCLSYLALVSFLDAGGRRRLLLYAASLALAMYVEYSAIYALAPQIIVLGVAWGKKRRQVLELVGAGAVAALAFMPWVPQVMHYAGPTSEQSQFAVYPTKVWDVLIGIVGLGGNSGYYLSVELPPWDRWPAAHPIMIAGLAFLVALGLWSLRNRRSVVLVLALSAGTILASVCLSRIYAGFTYRTVLYAVPGWAMLVAATPAMARRRAVAVTGGLVALIFVGLGALTLNTMYSGAFKQQYHLLANDVGEISSSPWPVLTYPAVTATLIDVYHPGILRGRDLAVGQRGQLPGPIGAGATKPHAVWYAYASGGFSQLAEAHLEALGYRQLMHEEYTGPLYLDLYALPHSRLGTPIPLSDHVLSPGQTNGWSVLIDTPGLRMHSHIGSTIELNNLTAGESAAVATAQVNGRGLMSLRFQARLTPHTGAMRAFLICTSVDGGFLDVAPNGAGASVPATGRWTSVQVAVLCPGDTAGVRVDLRNSGLGTAAFRYIRLQQATPNGWMLR